MRVRKVGFREIKARVAQMFPTEHRSAWHSAWLSFCQIVIKTELMTRAVTETEHSKNPPVSMMQMHVGQASHLETNLHSVAQQHCLVFHFLLAHFLYPSRTTLITGCGQLIHPTSLARRAWAEWCQWRQLSPGAVSLLTAVPTCVLTELSSVVRIISCKPWLMQPR